MKENLKMEIKVDQVINFIVMVNNFKEISTIIKFMEKANLSLITNKSFKDFGKTLNYYTKNHEISFITIFFYSSINFSNYFFFFLIYL